MHVLYRLSRGIQVNLGQIIFRKIASYASKPNNQLHKVKLPHPFLVSAILFDQGFCFNTSSDPPFIGAKSFVPNVNYTGPRRFKDLPWTQLADSTKDRQSVPSLRSSFPLPSTRMSSKPAPPVRTPAHAVDPLYLLAPTHLISDLQVALNQLTLSQELVATILANVQEAARRGGDEEEGDTSTSLAKAEMDYDKALDSLFQTREVVRRLKAASSKRKEKVVEEEVVPEKVEKAKGLKRKVDVDVDVEIEGEGEEDLAEVVRRGLRDEDPQFRNELVEGIGGALKEASLRRESEISKGVGSSTMPRTKTNLSSAGPSKTTPPKSRPKVCVQKSPPSKRRKVPVEEEVIIEEVEDVDTDVDVGADEGDDAFLDDITFSTDTDSAASDYEEKED